MRLVLAATVVLLAFGPASGRDGAGDPLRPPPVRAVLALDCGDCPRGARVGWFDPLTLKPLPGRRLRLQSTDGPPGVSPDGRRLLVVDARRGSLRVVDAARLRVEWRVELGLPLAAGAWIDRDRFVALVGGSPLAALEARTLDVRARRVTAGGAMEVEAWVADQASSSRHLVTLLGSTDGGLGPVELALVDVRGRLRTIVLDRIESGFVEEDGVARGTTPALAVDPRGGRAAVVAPSGLVAEIDLVSGAVSYHELRRETGVGERLRAWLEPSAQAKEPVEGSFRRAVWLSNGLIALTGEDSSVIRRRYELEQRTVPIGLHVVEPSDWSVRTVHERAATLTVADRVLLAWTFPSSTVPREYRRVGITGYSLDGSRRFELFRGRQVSRVQAAGRYAYAEVVGLRGLHVIDVVAGRVVRRLDRAASWPTLLR